MKLFFYIFLFFSSNFALAQSSLSLNDVTILLPLPKSPADMDYLLSPTTQLLETGSNHLLPAGAFKFLPVLTPAIKQDEMYTHNLKVIGIRFDPCFHEGNSPLKCKPQIRLIWQPIYFRNKLNNEASTVNTIDAAIHTFYSLDTSSWKNIYSELKNISKSDPKAALQINPTLLLQGYNGEYWSKLKNLVLRHAGEKNLVRATAMTVRMDRVWGFMGIDLIKNQWTPIEIPTLKIPDKPDAKITSQAFFLEPESLMDLSEFKGGASLMEVNNKSWFKLFSDSKKYAETQTEDEIKNSISIAYKMENPNLNNPGTTDCVSCHVAQAVKLWGENRFKNWNTDLIFKNEKYINNIQNLKNTSVNPQNTNRLRAFGYFDDEPIISQRVINETAAILEN